MDFKAVLIHRTVGVSRVHIGVSIANSSTFLVPPRSFRPSPHSTWLEISVEHLARLAVAGQFPKRFAQLLLMTVIFGRLTQVILLAPGPEGKSGPWATYFEQGCHERDQGHRDDCSQGWKEYHRSS